MHANTLYIYFIYLYLSIYLYKKNTGVGCHCLLQCMKVKSESEVAQPCPTPSDPMDCSPPGPSVHGSFQARVLEWGAIAFSNIYMYIIFLWLECGWTVLNMFLCCCSGLIRLSLGLLTSTMSYRTIGLVCLWIFL